LGRSLHNYHRAAVEAGIWDAQFKLIDAAHLGYLPRHEVLAVATGSQGEPRTALRRLVAGTHPDLDLQAGDCVLFSSRVIPGNEVAVAALLQQLRGLGVDVVSEGRHNRPIHASGHPAQDELMAMYRWLRPQVTIPVHGEPAHLHAHGELAAAVGVPTSLVGRNGDLFMLAPIPGVRRRAVPVARLGLERDGLVRLSAS